MTQSRKRPRESRETLPHALITEERDGKLWLRLGRGGVVEAMAAKFVEMFPDADTETDIWDDVWVWQEGLAADGYARLGVRVSVEWFEREPDS